MTETRWLDSSEQTAWRSYLRMQRLLETHLTRHLQREFGLSGADYEILVNLSESESGRMRAFELGEATQWEKSRMSHHLSRMEKRGLISKEACQARYPEIVLTEQGRAAIERAAPRQVELVRELFVDAVGPDGLEAFTESCDSVIAAFERHDRESCPPEVRGFC